MNVALETLVQTLTVLQQGTALDLAGETEAAVEMYTAAKDELDGVIPYLPRGHADVVRRHSLEIKCRIDSIKRNKYVNEVKNEFPSFSVEYVPHSRPVEEYRVPANPTFRVLWLMQLLERSIRQGACVTPDLYVGREVWYQHGGGTALSHIGPKIRYLTALCGAMEQLRTVTNLSNLDNVVKSLRSYLKTSAELTMALEVDTGIYPEKKPPPPRSKIERGVRGLFHKGQQVLRTWMNQEPNLELCLIWAVNALEQAQLFERWIIYFSQMHKSPAVTDALGLLHRIVEVLYNGPCSFLLRDMLILVERHQEKCRKSTIRLLPVDVKLEGTTN